MPISQPYDLLKGIFFLRDIDEGELQALADTLERKQYHQGEVILRQGAQPGGMYFIAQGGVEVLQKHPDRGERILSKLEAGDTFGEMEMITPKPRLATVRANQPTVAYRWDREGMTKFMKSHPLVLAGLKFAVRGKRLAQRLRFSWLTENEIVYGLTRKHSAILYQVLTLPLMILSIAALLVFWGLYGAGSLMSWLGIGTAIPAIALGIWRWVDWGNDYYIVTNKRVLWLEKVVGIYDSRTEAPLHMVLSVSVSTDVVGRMLGYGDVIIRTFTGRVVFRNVENPSAMAGMVEEHWQRMMAKKDGVDRESLRKIVRRRLVPQQEDAEPIEAPTGLEGSSTVEEETGGSGRLGRFQVRFEDRHAITYRKHWAVLMREIGVPSALILVVAGLIGARIVGLITISSLTTFLLIAILALMALFTWWVYRYVDWANDIYQVTPKQIVDVYKKPLAREVRKVAPIENILGSEVDRKGIVGILLNYGDVIANVGTEKFSFEGVFDPAGVQQDILHAQEAFLERKQDTQRRQRRDEMVELLDIYHAEYAARGTDRQNDEEA